MNASTTFEEEARPHVDRLFRFAMWLERDRAEAEDLVQETRSAKRSITGPPRQSVSKAANSSVRVERSVPVRRTWPRLHDRPPKQQSASKKAGVFGGMPCPGQEHGTYQVADVRGCTQGARR